jgi:hypothetical protein
MGWCHNKYILLFSALMVAATLLRADEASTSFPAWPETATATNQNVTLKDVLWPDLATLWQKTNVQEDGSPIENLTLPLEHHLNGRVKTVLQARTAIMSDERYIRFWGATIDLFTSEGLPDGRIQAENGIYDRETQRGYCPGAIKLVRTDVQIAGKGVYWSAERQRMRILAQGEVRTTAKIGVIGGKE